MNRITLTIPKRYNDGRDVKQSVHKRIESRLLDLYNGFTRIDVYGQWIDESAGKVYADESWRYEILTEVPHAYNTLHQYACNLCTILGQSCILTTCETVQANFVS